MMLFCHRIYSLPPLLPQLPAATDLLSISIILSLQQIWVLSSHSFFLLSFWDSSDMHVRSFVIVPQVPEALLIFFFFQSIFHFSVWVISVIQSSTSLMLPSGPFIDTNHWALITVFLSSRISIWLFRFCFFAESSCFVCWGFLIFHSFRPCLKLLMERFYHDCFKVSMR